MPLWSSLYCHCDDTQAVADHLRDSLIALRYTLYDPFGALPGPAYPHQVRLFVAPARAGWVRVLGHPAPEQLPALSQMALVIHLALDGAQEQIAIYAAGAVADEHALTAALRPPRTPADFARALHSAAPAAPASAAALPLDALPESVRGLAGGVNSGQAGKLFNRLSNDLLGRFGQSADLDAARALVNGAGVPDWHSTGGARVKAAADCLTLPENWQYPDFESLRDSYQLRARQRRRPDAPLYPGDAEIMAQVPDALDYIPLYGGKRDGGQ
jgi:hypothetical protein